MDMKFRHNAKAVLAVGAAMVMLVLFQMHDEFTGIKLLSMSINNLNEDDISIAGDNTTIPNIEYKQPTFETFFPFHAASSNNKKNNCVTRQQILDISQTTRHLLTKNIRIFPRNGFLLGIIRHGGYLPNERVDEDMGIVATDIDNKRFDISFKGKVQVDNDTELQLKTTEEFWVNWRGKDPVTQKPYMFFSADIHHGKFTMHVNSVYPYNRGGNDGGEGFFYPYLSVKRFNHDAAVIDSIRYNKEGADLRLVDTDERVDESNYKEGLQMGNVFNTRLDCFIDKQFYFTTIPVPCDYDIILTSFYGTNWNRVENRGAVAGETKKEWKEMTYEAHVVSEEENDKLLLGGPQPMCLS